MPAYVKTEVFFVSILAILAAIQRCNTATIKDVLTDSSLIRVPRDNKYQGRYNSRTEDGEKNLKPEESQDSNDNQGANLGKRCIRCDNGYGSSSYDRYPDDRRGYYDDRSRDRDYDRYDDRYNDRYDRDSRPYDRQYDKQYDRYDRDRYPSRSRYPARNDRYDRYNDRYNDRYDYDRYEPYDRYDKYDRYDRYSDRGVGYDNRGYDYRSSDRESYRPLDETYRGSSGFDSSGRGYYFASGGRPEYSGQGYGYGSGRYASGWDYGSGGGGGRDDYRDRGYYGSSYRPYRDPYDGYRTTSYLYGRPSSTTIKPPNSGDNGNTQSPQESSG